MERAGLIGQEGQDKMNRREGEDRMDMIDRKDKRVGEKIWRGRLARTG